MQQRGPSRRPGTPRRPQTAVAALAVLAMLLAWPASALPGPLDILSLPADVDVAMCIDRGAEASRLASGKAARQMTQEMATGLGLPAAWNELWKALDLPADEAVDRLLGRRVLIAWRWNTAAPGAGRSPPVEPDWVIISLVSESTERRLRERLRPAPRDIEAGQAILALEDGRFLLTTRVLDHSAGRAGRGERSALLMLAPAAHVSLFKDMLPRLAERSPGASLGDDPELARLRRLLDADIAALARGRGPAGGAAADVLAGDREIAAMGAWWRRGEGVEARGTGLDARLVRIGSEVPRELPTDAGLASGQIDRLAEGALLAVSDVLPRFPGGGRGTEPDRATIGLGIAQGPTLASIVATITRMVDAPRDGAPALLGPETIAIVSGTGRSGDPLSLTLGVAAPDLSAVAPRGDRLMAMFLEAPPMGGDDRIAGPDFGGSYPPAVRTADIPEGSLARLGGLLGDSPTIAWQFAPRQGATPALSAAGKPGGDAERPGAARPSPWAVPGWWVARLSQAPAGGDAAEALRRTSRLLTSEQDERGVLISGVVRPAELLAALASVGVPVPPAMGAMRWVSRVRWEGGLSEPGRLAVDVSIDLNPAMGATPP